MSAGGKNSKLIDFKAAIPCENISGDCPRCCTVPDWWGGPREPYVSILGEWLHIVRTEMEVLFPGRDA